MSGDWLVKVSFKEFRSQWANPYCFSKLKGNCKCPSAVNPQIRRVSRPSIPNLESQMRRPLLILFATLCCTLRVARKGEVCPVLLVWSCYLAFAHLSAFDVLVWKTSPRRRGIPQIIADLEVVTSPDQAINRIFTGAVPHQRGRPLQEQPTGATYVFSLERHQLFGWF